MQPISSPCITRVNDVNTRGSEYQTFSKCIKVRIKARRSVKGANLEKVEIHAYRGLVKARNRDLHLMGDCVLKH